MGCNATATPNLHRAAFFVASSCEIFPYMERKYKNYVREWRKKKGFTQKVLLARLVELAGERVPDDPELRVPTTEASLSRIENGKQNFNMATLMVLADALEVDEPGWLLDRNPLIDPQVIDLVARLDARQREQAKAVLEAMFGVPEKQSA